MLNFTKLGNGVQLQQQILGCGTNLDLSQLYISEKCMPEASW